MYHLQPSAIIKSWWWPYSHWRFGIPKTHEIYWGFLLLFYVYIFLLYKSLWKIWVHHHMVASDHFWWIAFLLPFFYHSSIEKCYIRMHKIMHWSIKLSFFPSVWFPCLLYHGIGSKNSYFAETGSSSKLSRQKFVSKYVYAIANLFVKPYLRNVLRGSGTCTF